MSNDADAEKGGPTAPISRSAAAERMRAHRERRKAGLRCLTIELLTTEIDELIRRKLLDADARNDLHAIMHCIVPPPRSDTRRTNVMRNRA